MKTSQNGRNLIVMFEGSELTAYKDQRGIWTICSGHTGPAVVEGMTCTPEQCDAYLAADLATAEHAVNALGVDLNQNRFDACVSLAYNIGAHAFSKSTVAADIRAGHFYAAAVAFLLWEKTNGEVNPGLIRRRQAEKALFSTPIGVS
jgi:lysozyme